MVPSSLSYPFPWTILSLKAEGTYARDDPTPNRGPFLGRNRFGIRPVKPCGEGAVQQGPPVAANVGRNVEELQLQIDAAKKQEMPQTTRHKGAKSSSIREKARSNVYASLLSGIPSAPGGNKDYRITLSDS